MAHKIHEWYTIHVGKYTIPMDGVASWYTFGSMAREVPSPSFKNDQSLGNLDHGSGGSARTPRFRAGIFGLWERLQDSTRECQRWFNAPPKFNIALEKWWLEDYFPIGKVAFQGAIILRFRVYQENWSESISIDIYRFLINCSQM